MVRKVIAGKKVGSLEEAILAYLWKAERPLTGREIVEGLPGPARAYTTVMTVLGRLEDKGMVERISGDRGFRYRAAGDQEQLTAQAIGELLASARNPATVLAYFVEGIDDPSLLQELASLLERTKAEDNARASATISERAGQPIQGAIGSPSIGSRRAPRRVPGSGGPASDRETRDGC